MRKKNPLRFRERRKRQLYTGDLVWGGIWGPSSQFDDRMQMESMTDTVGFRDCLFNPCQHSKILQDGLKHIPYLQYTDGINWSLICDEQIGPKATGILGGLNEVRPPSPGYEHWLDDFAAFARTKHTEAIKDDASIINFLIELKELIETFPAKLHTLWAAFWSAIRQYKNYLAKHPGQYWLAWNFCLRPMLKDIKSLLGIFRMVHNRLEYLRKHNRKPIISHARYPPVTWSVSGAMSAGIMQWPVFNGSPVIPPQDLYIWYEGTIETEVSSWAEVVFDIDDWLVGSGYLVGYYIALLDGLWITNPLKILWEAMPFSWLADWVIGRRHKEWRDQFGDLSPFKDAKILREGYSVKWTYSLKLKLCRDRLQGGSDQTDLGTVTCRTYQRAPGEAISATDAWRVPLEWYNLSILGALLSGGGRRR